MASEKITTLTDTNFEQSVIKAPQPVLVDFWAEWCGPCKRLGQTIDELASDYDGRVTVAKLNVDRHRRSLQHSRHPDTSLVQRRPDRRAGCRARRQGFAQEDY